HELIYTSTKTLTTNAGTPLYPVLPGRLIAVKLNVAGSPTSSTLTCDVLLNGTSMFSSLDTKPTIPAGQAYGYKQIVSAQHWTPDNNDYLQVQLTAVGGATGPLVAILEYYSDR